MSHLSLNINYLLILSALMWLTPQALAEPCPQRAAGQSPLPVAAIQRGGVIQLGDGEYYLNRELTLNRPVVLRGNGPSRTKLSFCIGRGEASIRVLSSQVVLDNFHVEIIRREIGSSAGGAEGTAITIGTYLTGGAMVPVRNVGIQNILVTRGLLSENPRRVSYSGNAIAIVGDSAFVSLHNVRIRGRHSWGIMAHWGGVFKSGCSAEYPFLLPDGSGRLACAIGTTYHPNNILIDGLDVANAGGIFGLSSVYNVEVKNVSGSGQAAFFLFAGDEGRDLARPEQKKLIGINIAISDINVRLLDMGGKARPPILMGGLGKSKFDGSSHKISFKDLTVTKVTLSEHPSTPGYLASVGVGISARNMKRSKNVVIKDVDLGELGENQPNSVAVSVYKSEKIKILNVKADSVAKKKKVRSSKKIKISFASNEPGAQR